MTASKLRNLLFGLLVTIFGSITTAHAVLINTSVGSYEVSAILDGTFENLATTLDDQPWWNDINLAEEFTSAVFGSLGEPNAGGLVGPIFAIGSGPFPATGTGDFVQGCTLDTTKPAAKKIHCADDLLPVGAGPVTFASAVRIPEPTTLYLLGLSLLGLGWGKHRVR